MTITYVVHEDMVEIFGQFPDGFLDGEAAKDDPTLPSWIATADPGIYDAEGKPLEDEPKRS